MGGDAYPLAIFENPGVDETPTAHDRLPAFDGTGAIRAGHDGKTPKCLCRRRFSDHLCDLRVPDLVQKFSLGEQRSIRIDVGQSIVEQCIEGSEIFESLGLIPCMFESKDSRPRRGLIGVLRMQRRGTEQTARSAQ